MTTTWHFPAQSITVQCDKQPNGEWTAIDRDNYEPGFPQGWGSTEMEAIADLTDQMREREFF